jgi:hypothetical protein
MLGDVCYLGAYYNQSSDSIVPATTPFILTSNGELQSLVLEPGQYSDMVLKRKYPRFARMSLFARKLVRSTVEASNDREFRHYDVLMTVIGEPGDVNDSILCSMKQYRYVRWHIVDYRTGDLAEVSFYGKHSFDSPEVKLQGNVIGAPEDLEQGQPIYAKAMDGNIETYFVKPKDQYGFVGLDLGEGNESYITRVHFHPRSDSNYIQIGDRYTLSYWDVDHWCDLPEQIAVTHELSFSQVPQGTIYVLHNLSRGHEERIFTYQNGEQIWW